MAKRAKKRSNPKTNRARKTQTQKLKTPSEINSPNTLNTSSPP
jgi:hypothetical protein